MYNNNMNRGEEWLNHLSEAVYDRLCQCETTKLDLSELVEARWDYGSETSKEEALEYICELLDANGLYNVTELTQDENDKILGCRGF